MKRFVLPCQPSADGRVHLCGKDYHYLVRVKRLKAGMCFKAVLPGGDETTVGILSTVDKTLVGECLDGIDKSLPSQPEGSISLKRLPSALLPVSPLTSASVLPPVALFQALPKGNKMDMIVRQAVEGGLSIIVPFEAEHSVVRLGKLSTERVSRWERIAREARQQSGSVLETKVSPPCKFDALLEYWESVKKEYSRPVGIILHQDPLATGNFHDYLGVNPDFVALAVGPEGGFSPAELSRFLATGWKPVTAGNTVLRTETAALYGAAAVRIILLESESWLPCRKE